MYIIFLSSSFSPGSLSISLSASSSLSVYLPSSISPSLYPSFFLSLSLISLIYLYIYLSIYLSLSLIQVLRCRNMDEFLGISERLATIRALLGPNAGLLSSSNSSSSSAVGKNTSHSSSGIFQATSSSSSSTSLSFESVDTVRHAASIIRSLRSSSSSMRYVKKILAFSRFVTFSSKNKKSS